MNVFVTVPLEGSMAPSGVTKANMLAMAYKLIATGNSLIAAHIQLEAELAHRAQDVQANGIEQAQIEGA